MKGKWGEGVDTICTGAVTVVVEFIEDRTVGEVMDETRAVLVAVEIGWFVGEGVGETRAVWAVVGDG